jgi:hypothetical protein
MSHRRATMARIFVPTLLIVAGHASHAQNETDSAAKCSLPELQQIWHRSAAPVPEATHRTEQPTWVGRTEATYQIKLQPCDGNDCGKFEYRAWLPVTIPSAGRYRVAIDQMLWIDAHGRQGLVEGVLCEHAGCAPMRKIVQYDLPAGTHWISLSGKTGMPVGVLVSRVSGSDTVVPAASWKR